MKKEPEKIGDTIISKIIGEKPRIPQTYAMRLARGTDADIEFCENVRRRVSEWEEKANIQRLKSLLEKEATKKEVEDFVVKVNPPLLFKPIDLYNDFKAFYKIRDKDKKDFNPKNPYSKNDEPINYVFTLIYYFMKDERFFDSPLLRKDLSEPSFNKGTITVGNYGCGKTSTFLTLLACFKNHIEFAKKQNPSNLDEIIKKYTVDYCVSSEIVDRYNTTKDKIAINQILQPLMTRNQLYIDDILREEIAFNFSPKNIFKDVLTYRAERDSKSHLTLNFEEIELPNGKVGFKNLFDSLDGFRTKYDGRIHDRLFGSYNIIELKGKSFRR